MLYTHSEEYPSCCCPVLNLSSSQKLSPPLIINLGLAIGHENL